MNPDIVPERLENFLSLLLGETVTIQSVLTNDSTRIGDEPSIQITDIVVLLSDGSLDNVEVQKSKYLVPGERCACYSSDLLLRQYKKVRAENKGKAKQNYYVRLRPVYTIVLFENSPGRFHSYPNHYIHRFEQKSDTGLKIELLQKYILIALDIFQEKMHNKPILNELDAWLMFFSTDDTYDMLQLLDKHPYFKPLYKTIYNICRNMEDVMGIFSEELKIMDENSIHFVHEHVQREIDYLAKENYEITKEKEQAVKKVEQITAEKEQAVKETEQARLQINSVALYMLRKVTPEDFSAEEYADLLSIDCSIIKQIYEKLHSDPAPDEDELFALLNQRK